MKKLQEEKNYYSSSDLPLVVALSMHFPIEETNFDDPHRVNFYFRRSKKLEEIVKSYWDKSCMVDAASYFQELKAIKNRLFTQKNN